MNADLLLLLVPLAYIAGTNFLVLYLLHRLPTVGANPCRRHKRLCVALGAVLATAGVLITAYTAPALALLTGAMMIFAGTYFALPHGLVPWREVERSGDSS